MTNKFLQVNKDFYNLGLKPIELLILAQISEFQRNTNDCFISDEAMANNFGVSAKTVSNALKSLEEKNFITRNTKNIKGGRERHLSVREDQIEKFLQQKK
jgi:DNA-binding MarR family transcriptional regulator